MSVDVLYYNELSKQVCDLQVNKLPAAQTCWTNLGTACGSKLGLASSTSKQQYYPQRAGCDLNTKPWDCTTWATIPTLSNVTGGAMIADTTYYRCGVCCLWTVPAGVNYVRFQMWGAGAGSHNMCCCGGGMWGGSGAYASVIIPTKPGCQYTICAGCAACCYMTSAGPTGGPGCQSFVTGYNLCNLCASGGDPSPYCWIRRITGEAGGVCTLMNASTYYSKIQTGAYYGWCMCSGGGWCWGNNCSGHDSVPFVTSCKTYYGCVPEPSKTCHFVIGAPGVYNAVNYFDTCYNEVCKNLYHPPIINQTCGCCLVTMNASSTDAGCQYNPSSYLMYYGRGGWPSSVSGGTGNNGGGVGAGGAVCIQYTTDL